MGNMGVGKRIRALREEQDMTLDEVARKCGTTRQTIYKYENDIVTKIPYDKIELLAKALNTTPSPRFGWEDIKLSPDENKITEGEQVLLDLFRRVPEDQQKLVLQMIRAALGSQ